MRWPIFILLTYFMLVLQVGLAPGLAIETSLGPAEPRFMLLLAVFIALEAPQNAAMIACGLIGMLLDVTTTWPVVQLDDLGVPVAHIALTLIGPYTLGHLAGGYLIIQLRPMLFRRHPLTIASMMIASGVVVHLIVLGLFTLRNGYEPIAAFSPSHQLATRGFSLLYSAGLGILLSIPLTRIAPVLNFQPDKKHPSARGPRRRSMSSM